MLTLKHINDDYTNYIDDQKLWIFKCSSKQIFTFRKLVFKWASNLKQLILKLITYNLTNMSKYKTKSIINYLHISITI